MNTVNLTKIIENYNLDKAELASLLFPKNIHASLALNRACKGVTTLGADQLSLLASFIGVEVSELYTTWKHTTVETTHVFTADKYVAKLNLATGVTKIFHKESLMHESVLNSGALVLSEYLNQLDLIIKTFENELSGNQNSI